MMHHSLPLITLPTQWPTDRPHISPSAAAIHLFHVYFSLAASYFLACFQCSFQRDTFHNKYILNKAAFPFLFSMWHNRDKRMQKKSLYYHQEINCTQSSQTQLDIAHFPRFPQQCNRPHPQPLHPHPALFCRQVLQDMAFLSLCLGSFLIHQSLFVWGRGGGLDYIPCVQQCPAGLSVTALFWITKCSQALKGNPKELDCLPPNCGHGKIPSLFHEGNDNWLIVVLMVVPSTCSYCSVHTVCLWE